MPFDLLRRVMYGLLWLGMILTIIFLCAHIAKGAERVTLPCEVCLKLSDDSSRVLISRCPKDSTTLYHVQRIGKKYTIETIRFIRGKDYFNDSANTITP
jgi:hypothetical protein